MKNTFIIANWKSNKTSQEATSWMNDIRFRIQELAQLEQKEIIVCPSFPLLPVLKSLILDHKSPIKLGAQDISPFDEGAYTGAVNGKQLKEYADYILIGHSERRTHFGETYEMLALKVQQCLRNNLIPVFLAQDHSDPIPPGISLVVYEPPTSISPGAPDTPENATENALALKKNEHITTVLYGGNVTAENVASFMKADGIDGVLVGRASLSPQEFSSITHHA